MGLSPFSFNFVRAAVPTARTKNPIAQTFVLPRLASRVWHNLMKSVKPKNGAATHLKPWPLRAKSTSTGILKLRYFLRHFHAHKPGQNAYRFL